MASDQNTFGASTWSADSKKLVFVSERTGFRIIWELEVDSGRLRQITSGPSWDSVSCGLAQWKTCLRFLCSSGRFAFASCRQGAMSALLFIATRISFQAFHPTAAGSFISRIVQ
jgi:hypothetical protein